MTTYFFIAASEKFLTVEEPLDEILKERMRNYKENNKEIDFWLLKNPSFLQTHQFADLESPAYVTCRVPTWRVLTKEPENLHKSPLIPEKAIWKII